MKEGSDILDELDGVHRCGNSARLNDGEKIPMQVQDMSRDSLLSLVSHLVAVASPDVMVWMEGVARP
jgi:hypothetical protein